MECTVCSEQTGEPYACANNHVICSSCLAMQLRTRDDCCVCRSERGYHPSVAGHMAHKLGMLLPCGTCDSSFPARRVDAHRRCCPELRFNCPLAPQCVQRVSVADMAMHLQMHGHIVDARSGCALVCARSDLEVYLLTPKRSVMRIGTQLVRHLHQHVFRVDMGVYGEAEDICLRSIDVGTNAVRDEVHALVPRITSLTEGRGELFCYVKASVRVERDFTSTIKAVPSHTAAVASLSKILPRSCQRPLCRENETPYDASADSAPLMLWTVTMIAG